MPQVEPQIESVSDTALWVAVHRAEEGDRPDALFHDPLSRRLAGERGKRIAASMPHAPIMAWVMAIRTVAIDRLVIEALGKGADTVLNLGAGLDTRPYRMELPSALRWVEVDFPNLIDYKNHELVGEKPRCRLERVSLDLSNREERRRFLARVGAESQRVVVITEGVLPYLTNDAARELAEDLAAVPNFEFWIQDFMGGNLVRVMPKKVMRRLQSAPFKLTVDDWFEFFAKTGWVPEQKIFTYDEARRLKRRPPFPIWSIFLYLLMPRRKKEALRTQRGYVLLKKKPC